MAAASFAQNGPADLEVGRLLVASRELRDPSFRETVVLVLEYSRSEGAVGVVVNRPSEIELGRILTDVDGAAELTEPVFIGGPVEPLQFTFLVRAESPPEDSEWVFADVFRSGSRKLLERLATAAPGSETFRAYAGYAGWVRGQLEAEIAAGAWHVLEGSPRRVFDASPRGLWSKLILIGTAEWAAVPPAASGAAGVTFSARF